MTSSRVHLLQFIAVFAFWAFMALNPVDVKDFWLESILLITLGVVLVATYRAFRFSTASYFCIALFLCLHTIGAHYTYANVPFGFALQDFFSFSRNMFDRIVHFSFGLLFFLPIYELLKRTSGLKGFWLYYIPADIILATSGLFEIIEMTVAVNISPELGAEYLGMQGDIWDAQKDMLCATVGAVVMSITLFMINIFVKRRKFN